MSALISHGGSRIWILEENNNSFQKINRLDWIIKDVYKNIFTINIFIRKIIIYLWIHEIYCMYAKIYII